MQLKEWMKTREWIRTLSVSFAVCACFLIIIRKLSKLAAPVVIKIFILNFVMKTSMYKPPLNCLIVN